MKDLSGTGHIYALDEHEAPTVQRLYFVQKEKDAAGNFVTVHEGTTNEEVLACLIDRLGKLQAKFPCRENALAITKLEEALMWLNKRTADRKARGVEGTPNK